MTDIGVYVSFGMTKIELSKEKNPNGIMMKRVHMRIDIGKKQYIDLTQSRKSSYGN